MGKAPKQQDITLEALNQKIWQHMEARDWHKNPSRGLAISMALEANELLEHYQWGETPAGGTEAVGDELADVFIYGMLIAQRNNIDIAHHIQRKLDKSDKKYPAEKFKGVTGTEHSEAWLESKLSHQKEGL